jgi:hypothetical protein
MLRAIERILAHRHTSRISNPARLAVERLERHEPLSAATISVVSAIVNSLESFRDFVTTEFTTFLGRPPGIQGRAARPEWRIMMPNVMVGTRAPSFSLLCTDGPRSGRRQVSLDDYLDRWLMLLFYSRDFSLV